MICKKCSAEYDDNCLACPVCSEKNEATVEDGFLDEEVCIVGDVEELDEDYAYGEYYQEAAYQEPAYQQYSDEDNVQAADMPDEKKSEDIAVRHIKPSRKKEKRVRPEKQKASKEEKKIIALLSLIVCLVGAIAAVLTVMRIKTDAFEQQVQQQQTVALSKLSEQEEVLLEKELSAYYSVARIADFHGDTCTAEDFLVCINPADTGNIYARVLGETATLQTAQDPANRFSDENGEYAYYKVEGGKIDRILNRFGLTSDGNINCRNYYYYDGFYYFRASQAKKVPVVSVEITKSKKVLDGSFYAEFYFYLGSGAAEVKSDSYYVCVEKNSTIASGQNFVVKEMSSEPIFDEAGKLISHGTVQYTTEKKVIEGKTNDGTLYCRYVVEYPVFTGESAGEKSVNSFFAGVLSSYELRASGAQQNYEDFISKGGKATELPFSETVIARLSYSDSEKIAVAEKISSYSPELPEAVQGEDSQQEAPYYEDQTEEAASVKLFDRSVEAYVFDRITGSFIEKDESVGKDYMLISEILYRIYNSYEYEALLPAAAEIPVTDEYGNPVEGTDASQSASQQDEDYYGSDDGDDVPEDEYGIGTEIYESACAYTAKGFTFFYVEEGGYITEVTLPLEAVERLAQ